MDPTARTLAVITAMNAALAADSEYMTAPFSEETAP